jgi:hypothetical protein
MSHKCELQDTLTSLPLYYDNRLYFESTTSGIDLKQGDCFDPTLSTHTARNMIEIAALLLCKLGGKAGSAADIKAVLEAAGAAANDDEIAKLTGDMEGKDINELLAAGAEKVKDIPLAGGG